MGMPGAMVRIVSLSHRVASSKQPLCICEEGFSRFIPSPPALSLPCPNYLFWTTQKKKREGEEEAEDRVKHSDCDLLDNKYSCADSKNGKFPNEQTNFEPSGRINYSVSENLDGASLSEAPIPTDEQAIITTPPTKFVTAAEDDSTDVKALQRKMSSIAKKKTTSKEDCKVKLCGMLLDDLLLLMHLCS
jgi:hypothetical protein